MSGVTVGVTGENFSKFKKRKIIKKYRKTLVLSGFTVLFGGDKRDRTADLLNAIQCKTLRASKGFWLSGGHAGVTEI